MRSVFKNFLTAFVSLSRIREYIGATVLATSLGVIFIRPVPPFAILMVLLANIFNVMFAFMINDIEDFEDDIKCETKASRNMFATGKITPKIGYAFAFNTLAISLTLYYLVDIRALLIGLCGSVVAFLYSWRRVRLKSIPLFDLLAHGLFLWTTQFYATVASSKSGAQGDTRFLVVGTLIFVLSALADLAGEMRDYEVDRVNGIRNTASMIGICDISVPLVFFESVLLIYTASCVSRTAQAALTVLTIGTYLYYRSSYANKGQSFLRHPFGNVIAIAFSVALLFFF